MNIDKNFLKYKAHRQTNNFKYFCIEKLKQENPDLTYFKYRSVYDFDIF